MGQPSGQSKNTDQRGKGNTLVNQRSHAIAQSELQKIAIKCVLLDVDFRNRDRRELCQKLFSLWWKKGMGLDCNFFDHGLFIVMSREFMHCLTVYGSDRFLRMTKRAIRSLL